jgi:hypothetical protein
MPSLRDHYLRTTYRVTEVDPPIDIRIGEPCPLLDALLEKHAAHAWVFITAWNPGSKKLDDSENRRRQQQLEAEVKQSGNIFYRGAGVPDEKDWQPEESLLILGIELGEAHQLGNKYGQAAVVAGKLNVLPELIFIQ